MKGSIMLAQQRRREIMSLLQGTGAARVAELAQRLSVTEETIRRDLKRLDREGKLIRTHGGAVASDGDRLELPFDERHNTNRSEKQAIAARALAHIEEGDVIGIDASTTACELARQLPDLPLTVVTSSIVIASMLIDRPRIDVMLTGGLLDRSSLSLMGTLAGDAVERFNIRRLFISCRGIDLQRGLTEASEPHAQIKQRMIRLAEQVYLLADHSKFGLRSVVYFAQVADIDVLITDPAADPTALAEFRTAGAQIELAEGREPRMNTDKS